MKLKKKILMTIGGAIMATTMFFGVNTNNALKGDLDLASLSQVNTANAECDQGTCNTYCYIGSFCWIWCNGQQLDCSGYSNTP